MNCLLIWVFYSDSLGEQFQLYDDKSKLLFLVVVENSLLFLKLNFQNFFPEVPNWVNDARQTEDAEEDRKILRERAVKKFESPKSPESSNYNKRKDNHQEHYNTTQKEEIVHQNNVRKQHEKKYVRLQVKGGGCAGFEYEWSFSDEETRNDVIVDNILLIDRINELYLTGMELDYKKEIWGSNFEFKNPMAKSSCGCGTSFSV